MVLVTYKLIIILIIWLEETFHFFLQKPFLSFTNHTMSSDLDEFLKEVDNISKSNEENEFSASSTANPHVLVLPLKSHFILQISTYSIISSEAKLKRMILGCVLFIFKIFLQRKQDQLMGRIHLISHLLTDWIFTYHKQCEYGYRGF